MEWVVLDGCVGGLMRVGEECIPHGSTMLFNTPSMMNVRGDVAEQVKEAARHPIWRADLFIHP